MKNETFPAVPEITPPESPNESNLLDMARERAARRAEHQKRKLIKQASAPRKGADPLDDDERLLGKRQRSEKFTAQSLLELPKIRVKARHRFWGLLSFFLAVVLPTVATGLYFAFIASPQYETEAQFTVRGTQEASLGGLGITALVGSTSQGGDSYIVADYIHSAQILKDLKDIAGLDIREIYSRSNIDFFYRSRSDTPLDEFVSYWRDMVNVSYNSTTGNVTLQVFAFSAEDAKSVTDAILTVSEKLVNTLSEESRNQFVSVANQQVARAEDRLKKARSAIMQLRQSEQAVDPTAVASMESSIIGELEKELATLKTRYKALVDTISKDAPSAKVLDRQITALEAQLSEQRARVGSGSATKTARDGTESAGNNVSEVIDRFSELLVEEEFATKAYTASLASLEAAVQDAQKQERYFATYVQPRVPEIALYPERGMNTLLTLLAFTALWLIGYFVVRSVKDHAI